MEQNSTKKTNVKKPIKKSRIGVVVSNKMDKSVVVAVTRQLRHEVYGKIIRKTAKIVAHDGENRCNIGDKVKIEECRPLSKTKRWQVVAVIDVAKE